MVQYGKIQNKTFHTSRVNIQDIHSCMEAEKYGLFLSDLDQIMLIL